MMPKILFSAMLTSLCTTVSAGTPPPEHGLVLACSHWTADHLAAQLTGYLIAQKMPPHLLQVKPIASHEVSAQLQIPSSNTLTLRDSPYMRELGPVPIEHPLQGTTPLTSVAEILAALLVPGRTTRLDISTSNGTCELSLLSEHLELRQNIVLWSQKLQWTFPDGEPAKWNPRYWNQGTPLQATVPFTVRAFHDVFENPQQYAIGCYTATKLVIVQAFLDYYHRKNPQPNKLNQVVKLLWSDGDPLVDIEPYQFWRFESDHRTDLPQNVSKLLEDIPVQAPHHFVPGDWSYFLNPDSASYARAGYEGSNAVYLGGNRFDDYYADTSAQSYSFEQKMDEIYQWRHEVFSRSRHAQRIEPLPLESIRALSRTPEEGGFLVPFRLVPKIIR